MRQLCTSMIAGAMAAAVACFLASPARGGYVANGYDLGLVQSGSGLVNGAASVQTNPLFGAYTRGTEKTTTFTIPACQTITFARLYLDVYGGLPYYAAQLTATLNGQTLPALTIGGTGQPSPGMPGDGNPSTRDPNATCVYGSGYGYWQIAYAGVAGKLNKDGSPNVLRFTVSDASNSFDGRQYGATLATIYTDPSKQQTLDYQLFEGDGYMRQTAASGPPATLRNLSRSLAITGVNTANVTSATYTAGYATGHSGQTDQIYFNGTSLGPLAGLGNDIARANSNTELHSFNVQSLLQSSNNISYNIDQGVLGGAGESSIHADMAMLTVTHPLPEPGAAALVAAGGLALLAWRRKQIGGKARVMRNRSRGWESCWPADTREETMATTGNQRR